MRRIIDLDLDQSRDYSLDFDPNLDYSLDCDPRIRRSLGIRFGEGERHIWRHIWRFGRTTNSDFPQRHDQRNQGESSAQTHRYRS
jgi:hypothetical protein